MPLTARVFENVVFRITATCARVVKFTSQSVIMITRNRCCLTCVLRVWQTTLQLQYIADGETFISCGRFCAGLSRAYPSPKYSHVGHGRRVINLMERSRFRSHANLGYFKNLSTPRIADICARIWRKARRTLANVRSTAVQAYSLLSRTPTLLEHSCENLYFDVAVGYNCCVN